MQIPELQKRFIHMWIVFMMLLTLLVIASTVIGLLITPPVGGLFFSVGFMGLILAILIGAGD